MKSLILSKKEKVWLTTQEASLSFQIVYPDFQNGCLQNCVLLSRVLIRSSGDEQILDSSLQT